MSLIEIIDNDIKKAMKEQDKVALKAIRAIKSALLLLKTESVNRKITKQDEINLLQRLVKQRKESIDIYKSQGRQDLVDEESGELTIIEKYLPAQMNDDELKGEIVKVINELQATTMKDIGKVMQASLSKLQGKADGKRISSIVKKLLQ